MRNTRTRVLLSALLTSVLAMPIVTACGSTAEDTAQSVVEQAVEGATGGDVEVSDDSMTVTDDSGNEFAVGEDITMPTNWPMDVPQYGGTLSMASVQTDGTAYAMWMTDASPAQAADDYGDLLTSEGFTLDQDSNMGGTVVREYQSATMAVSVVAGEADGTTTISVTAMPQ